MAGPPLYVRIDVFTLRWSSLPVRMRYCYLLASVLLWLGIIAFTVLTVTVPALHMFWMLGLALSLVAYIVLAGWHDWRNSSIDSLVASYVETLDQAYEQVVNEYWKGS